MVSLLHCSLLESKRSLCLVVVALHRGRLDALLVVDDYHLLSAVVLVVVVGKCFVGYVAAVVVVIVVGIVAAAVFAFDSRFAGHINCQIAVSLVAEQDSLWTRLGSVELHLLLFPLLCDADLQISQLVDQLFDGA